MPDPTSTAMPRQPAQRIGMASPQLLRLLQLVSPSLPTGAFSYSQGLEWAVAEGWVGDRESLSAWLRELLTRSLGQIDVPLLVRLHTACRREDLAGFAAAIDLLLACRESRELREEEQQRGRAMAAWLVGLGLVKDGDWRRQAARSQLAGFALAATAWQIPAPPAATGYLFSWLENQIIAGVKLIPLGQSAGQALLLELSDSIDGVVAKGLELGDELIGGSTPALALASMAHEEQYTRLYRS